MATADVDITARPISRDPSAPDGQPPQTGSNAAAARDDLDDLFNYDAQIDNVYRDVENNNNTSAQATGRRGRLDTGNEGGLGIDEEVKVRKPRAPGVKLDEDRLLSEKGIPKLRKITKERLRFRGKGHEFSDVSRLLNLYQLWLDDLFPKAKFADGLAMIEKLGHKKRLQVMRKAWIDEDKPKPTRDEQSEDDDDFIERGRDQDADMNDSGESQGPEHRNQPENGRQNDSQTHQEDETSLRLNEDDLYGAPSPRPEQTVNGEGHKDDGPEEDELDQLLAEDAIRHSVQGNRNVPGSHGTDGFDDDEEVMAELGW